MIKKMKGAFKKATDRVSVISNAGQVKSFKNNRVVWNIQNNT